ncbi:hypothetical protein [Paraconexibacter algicola]|uniref:Uncharacterized protein n=1 Tax=Paraconexibacter algicola TaxID=2133960 RepID=A0A2T4UCN1_9ACTN|nr:hypothetical protein [Paraconexibacter algicola]PTL54962.1 hypothetical protein C7Y72_20545 [Paraconexibacter algicola]
MTLPRSVLALLAALLTLAVAVPAASGQSNPFTPPAPLVAPEEVTPVPAPVPEDDDGLETWQQALIFLGGFALLAGIAVAIVVDARRRRPVTEEELRPSRAAQGDAEHRRAEHRKRKGKQKTQRAARKKNRPKRK